MSLVNNFDSVVKYEIVNRNEITPEEYNQAKCQLPHLLRCFDNDDYNFVAMYFARTLPHLTIPSQYLGLTIVSRCRNPRGLFELEVSPQWRHQGIGTKLSLMTMQNVAMLGLKTLEINHKDDQEKTFLRKLPVPKLDSYSNQTIFDLVNFKTPEMQPAPYSFRSSVFAFITNPGQLLEECNETARGFHYQIWEGEIERGTLLGTVHVVQNKYLKFNAAIRQNIEKSDIVYIEHIFSPIILTQIKTTDGQIFGGMENHLLTLAESKKKSTGSLETVSDLELYNTLPFVQKTEETVQERMLEINELGDIWAEGDVDKLLQTCYKLDTNFSSAERDIMEKRNIIHAQGIIKALEDKTINVFAAVGSLHLPDLHYPSELPIKGVITLLQENGFRITRIS